MCSWVCLSLCQCQACVFYLVNCCFMCTVSSFASRFVLICSCYVTMCFHFPYHPSVYILSLASCDICRSVCFPTQCPLTEPSACPWKVIWLWSFLCTTLAAVPASQKRMSMLTWHPSNYRGRTGLSSWRKKKKIRHKKLKLVKQLDCKNLNKKIKLFIAQIALCTKQKVPVNSDFLFYFIFSISLNFCRYYKGEHLH